ncbi:ankyrin repeat domain-containing protein [Magnetospirillum molischianum]|uniref:ankyrin repeat domain-containing protein n=1 Tax=Magnetospirillum molischianum TaxID=1083 RepID=UPI0002D9D1A8|nr:ankyrin repeat domain-containing protein [Magnetospirillum molischianum]
MAPWLVRIGLGLLVTIAGFGGGWLLFSKSETEPPPPPISAVVEPESPPVPVEAEAPQDSPLVEAVPDLPPSNSPQAIFARIQTELNRAAAGREPAVSDPTTDRLEKVADALRLILAGDAVAANRALDVVEAAVAARVPSEAKMAADPAQVELQEWLVSYFELLPVSPRKSGDAAVTAAFVRLASVLRKVDAVLLAGMLPHLTGYDLVARRAAVGPSAFDGRGLRFPCRLAATQRSRLEAAAKSLRQLAGPLTDCPVPAARAADFATLERFARDPVRGMATVTRVTPLRPGGLSTPLIKAAASGSLAEIEAALMSGSDPLRADGRGLTALHYLAGNRSLSAPDRNRAVALLF